jgi:hypothetical protein
MCLCFIYLQEEVSTEIVATTSTEVVSSTTVSDGLVSEEVVQTTTTTTTTTKATKTITTAAEADKLDKHTEQGSGDAPTIGNVDTEPKEVEITTQSQAVTEQTDKKETEESESQEKADIQSVLPNLSPKVINLDGKVLSDGKQASYLQASASSRTLMVVTKDGKKTLMRVIRQPNTARDGDSPLTVVSSTSSSSTEDSVLGKYMSYVF